MSSLPLAGSVMPAAAPIPPSSRSLPAVVRLALLASVVGAVSAYAALGFVICIGAVQKVALGFGHDHVVTALPWLPSWRVVLAPAIGGLLVGLLVRFAVRGDLAQGPTEVIESVHTRNGRMPLRRGLLTAVVSIISIGSGASVGRYGPAVHLGATLGSWLARYVALERSGRIALLGAGVAAAIAAAFNAPLAGVLFAHEVVIGGFAVRAVMPTVVAAAVGTSVARAHGAALPLFALPDEGVNFVYEYPLFLLVGLIGGGLAIAFMHTLDLSARHLPRVPGPDWARPMFGGFLIGCLALGFPQVFGLGEEAIQQHLNAEYTLWMLLALIPIKILATSCSLGFGFYGGILGPALFVGTTMGELVGLSLQVWLPNEISGPAVYAVAGMGAVISRMVGAPIATILIVLELTNSYTTTTAAMIAIVVASVVWSRRFPGSYFDFQLSERGVDPSRAREVALLRAQRVGALVSTADAVVETEATVAEGLDILLRYQDQDLFVVDREGALVARVTLASLVTAERAGRADQAIGTIARPPEFRFSAATNLHEAMGIAREFVGVSIPVVENEDTMVLMGVIHESDLIRAYDLAVEDARAEQWGR